MTKAEFLDQLAGDERIGSKKAAGDAVDAVLDAITEHAGRRRRRQLHRLRQVPRRRARPAPGRQPAHRRADHDPGRQGAALLRRLGAQDQGQGLSDSLKAPFADRLAALVEERRSQVCLGLDPDPAKLTGRGPRARPSRATPAESAATRSPRTAAG